MGARCLIQTQNNNSVFEILNPTNAVITLKQNTIVGHFIKIQDDKSFGELKENFEFIDNIRTGEALDLNNNYIKIATEMGIDLSKSDLNETQKSQLLILLGQYRQAFAKDITDFGCTKIGKHIIDTGEANPVRQFPYRTTPKTKAEINVYLNEMEEQGIIRKSMSPWSSPILLVAKPIGEKRAEHLSEQCTQILDEDQTIPKTTLENILQEPEHEQEQLIYETEQPINADLINEPQNPMYDTQLKLPLSGSRVLIAGSSVLKRINPFKLKEYIDVHVHRGANVLDLYDDIRSMDLSSYNTMITHVEGNDASSKINVQQFVDIYQEIINYVRSQNCRAIVSGILPRLQCDVTEYDRILKQMCHHNDVKFISNYESFVYKDDHIAKSFYTIDGIHLNRYGAIKLLTNVNKIIKVFKGKPLQYHLNQQNRNRFKSSGSQYYSNNFRRSLIKPRYQSRSNMNTTDRRNFNHSGINPKKVKNRNDLNMNSRDSWGNNNELNRQNVDRAPFFDFHLPNSVRKSDYIQR
ncbi:unnamed protein product [Mytilus coruscus]|uniref:Uncharacterized protein n=1 Tax=Mytilus coruscus TaxID=42192 RepID=A0A6J8CFX8_MYTCO|nr:unnamed protein product [Mytilus coruscus]